MATFTTAQVIRLTGVKRNMVHYLCKVGIVVPSASRKQGQRGHGVGRKYSFSDLVSFKAVKRLTESGVSPLKVKSAIRELHGMGIALSSLPSLRVVVFEKSVYKWDGKCDPFRLCDGQQAFGFILDLSAIHSELIEEIARFEAVA